MDKFSQKRQFVNGKKASEGESKHSRRKLHHIKKAIMKLLLILTFLMVRKLSCFVIIFLSLFY